MKHLLLAAAIALAPPAMAQEQTPEPPGLIERALTGLIDRFLNDNAEQIDELGRAARDLEPHLRDFAERVEPQMRDFALTLRPWMEEMAGLIDDLENYQPPERLPNGDLILRRKPDAPPLDLDQEGELSL